MNSYPSLVAGPTPTKERRHLLCLACRRGAALQGHVQTASRLSHRRRLSGALSAARDPSSGFYGPPTSRTALKSPGGFWPALRREQQNEKMPPTTNAAANGPRLSSMPHDRSEADHSSLSAA